MAKKRGKIRGSKKHPIAQNKDADITEDSKSIELDGFESAQTQESLEQEALDQASTTEHHQTTGKFLY